MPSFEVMQDNLNIQNSRDNNRTWIEATSNKHKKYNPFDGNHMPSLKVMQDNLNIQTSRDNDK